MRPCSLNAGSLYLRRISHPCTISTFGHRRLRILDQLHDIHRCGYWHNDFAERNVLLSKPIGDDGDTNDAILDVRIIDLSEIMPHSCELVKGVQGFSEGWSPTPTYSDNDGKKVDWRAGKAAPDVDDFGCRLLWQVCKEMRIWDP